MKPSRSLFAAPSFSPPSCSFWSNPSRPSNSCPRSADRPRSGSPVSSSFRQPCSSPISTPIGSRSVPIGICTSPFFCLPPPPPSSGPLKPSVSNSAHPVASIFLALGISIGLPFLMLGATSPLLQVWLARIQIQRHSLASLRALQPGLSARSRALPNAHRALLHPPRAAPHLVLRLRRIRARLRRPDMANSHRTLQLPRSQPGRRIANPSRPAQSQAALGSVAHGRRHATERGHQLLTANIAAIPLLWILPLAVYLITLILAFQFPRLLPRGIVTRFLVVMLAGLAYMLSQVDVSLPIRASASASFSSRCSSPACSATPRPTRCAQSDPLSPRSSISSSPPAARSDRSSSASHLRSSSPFNYDLVLTFLVTALLALAVNWSGGWPQRLLWSTASILLVALVFMLHAAYRRNTPLAIRNFYGSLRVRQSHSISRQPPCARSPTAPSSTARRSSPPNCSTRPPPITPKIRASASLCANAARDARAISASSVSAWEPSPPTASPAIESSSMRSIPPSLPSPSNLFTYLRESAAHDRRCGRRRPDIARRRAPQKFDVLVVDAFSGDAIPLHLLTTQAVALYKRHLAPGGIIAFHISNQHVDLEPEIALLAQAGGMKAMRVSSPANEETRRVQRHMDAAHRQCRLLLPAGRRKPPPEARSKPPHPSLDRRLLQPPASAPVGPAHSRVNRNPGAPRSRFGTRKSTS